MKKMLILIVLSLFTVPGFPQNSVKNDEAHRKRLDIKNGLSSRFDLAVHKIFLANIEKEGVSAELLNEYPIFRHQVDTALIGYIVNGEIIPDEIFDMPLRIYGYERANYVTLRELSKDRTLVLDFWAYWCKPCVESMDYWEKNYRLYGDSISFVGVNMDYDITGIRKREQFGWELPQIIGAGARILNRYLLGKDGRSVGPSAWIKDGKLFGISRANKIQDRDVVDIITGKVNLIPEHADHTLLK